MKKLMMAAAIVCAAVGVEAATANWSVSNVYDYDAVSAPTPAYTKANGYATYFVVATATFGVDEAIAAIAKGDFSWMSEQNVQQSKSAMESGTTAVTETPNWFGNDETVNAFSVVFDNSDYASAKHAFISDLKTDKTGGEAQPANLSFSLSSTGYANKWTTISADVPEPTSGLLLLLGVAGLALKRKRA